MFLFLKPAITFTKKTILVFAVFFVVLTLFSRFIQKDQIAIQPQIDPIAKNREEIYKVINDKNLTKSKEGKLTIALYRKSMCLMIGEACTDNPADGEKNFEKSTFGLITKIITVPFSNPPASGVQWAYDGLQNTGFVPKTVAAEGIGFVAIKPFANLWIIFRDLSYMLLVIVLIGIGFMIMFRAKLNPQTVISVENALPKIVISLILITFSFAIAGFIIDLMYIIIGIMVSVLIKDPVQAATYKNEYMMAGALDMLWRDIRLRYGPASIGAVLGNSLTQIIPIPIYLTLRLAAGGLSVFLLKGLAYAISEPVAKIGGVENAAAGTVSFGSVISSILKTTLSTELIIIIFALGTIYLIPWIVWFCIGFSVLFLFFRIFFMLITSYLKLIINIILAPLILLFEAVPGRNALKYWLLNIIGCLIPFPVIIFVFLLGYVIATDPNIAGMTGRLPYLYSIDGNAFRMMIAMGIIFLIPDFVKTLKEALGIKELPFNIGIGTYFGGVSAGAGGAIGLLGQVGSVSLGLQALSADGGIMKFGKEMFGKLRKAPAGGATGQAPNPQ